MEELLKIPYLTVIFRNELNHREVPLFRGAVLSKVPPECILFHNHIDNGFRYSYPLIQYKVIKGKAAIVCIGEGTEEIASLFRSQDFQFKIGERDETFEVDSITANLCILQVWDDRFKYKISGYLPLNSANYAKFNELDGMIEKVQMLEGLLTANLLSMLKGLGKHVEKNIECRITNLFASRTYLYKGVKMQGFDLDFTSNVLIPSYFSLGKGASLGFGVVKQVKLTNNK